MFKTTRIAKLDPGRSRRPAAGPGGLWRSETAGGEAGGTSSGRGADVAVDGESPVAVGVRGHAAVGPRCARSRPPARARSTACRATRSPPPPATTRCSAPWSPRSTTAGLVDTLNNAEDITVFAPTNDAFGQRQATLTHGAGRQGAADRVLTRHVVAGKLTPADAGRASTRR